MSVTGLAKKPFTYITYHPFSLMDTRSFFQKYSFTIIFILVFSLPFVWMGTQRTLRSNANNAADWLPKSFVETKEYDWFLDHFPYESFIVASWKGCTLDDPRLEMFAQKLVPGQTIDNMDQWVGQETREVRLSAELKLPDEKLAELALTSKTETVSKNVQDSQVPKENEPKIDDPQYFRTVITGPRLIRMMQNQYPSLKVEQIFQRLDGVLIGPQYDYQPGMDEDYKHRNTALIVTLATQAKGKELRKIVAKLKELARECGIEPPLPEDNRSIAQKVIDTVKEAGLEMVFGRNPNTDGVVLGGPPIDNVNIDYEGVRTLYRLAGLCAVLGLAAAYLCLKSFLLAIMVFWVGLLAAGFSLAFVSLTGQHCDSILLSMPALVYVLTMSSAVHMINYYFDGVREHGILHAPERMVQLSWYPCIISLVTTALGLLSLYTGQLIPIIKFGMFSAVAIMASLALLLLYLPALLYFYPPKKFVDLYANKGLQVIHDHIFIKFWRKFGEFIIRNHNVVAISYLAFMVFSVFGLFQIKTSVKMMGFFSRDAEIIHHYTWLEKQLGPLVPMEVVLKFDNEHCDLNSFERMQYVDRICRELRHKLPEQVGGVMSAATFAPDLNLDTNKRSARILSTAYATAGQIDARRSTSRDYILVEKKSLDPRTAKTPEEKEAFQKWLDQMGITSAQATQLVAAGLSTIDRLLYDSNDVNIPGLSGQEVKQLRDNAQNWQNKYGTDLWRISMRVWSLKKEIDYSLFIHEVKDVVEHLVGENAAANNRKVHSADAITAVYTGMVPVVYKAQHALLDGLAESFFWSFVSIMFVLMFVLRGLIAGFVAMLPSLFPVVIIFGILGWCGIHVDVGMMMSASVALAIAVDDTIHYMTWFRAAIKQGMNAEDAAIDAYEKCATAMTETTIIAACGLFAFIFSSFVPTQMFGTMIIVIMWVSLSGDLVFLVSVLTGPFGWIFLKKKKEGTGEGNSSEGTVSSPTPVAVETDAMLELKVDDRYVGRCHIVENMANNE